MVDVASDIIAYESGELSHDEIVGLFQKLVDSGLAWQLQGHYGRMALRLINLGYVTTKCEVCNENSGVPAHPKIGRICNECFEREGQRRAMFDRDMDERGDDD